MNPNQKKVLIILTIGGILGVGYAVYRDRNAEDETPVAEDPATVTADTPMRIATGGGFSGTGYNPNITPPQQITTPNIPNTTPVVTPPGNQTTAPVAEVWQEPAPYDGGRADGIWGGVVTNPEQPSYSGGGGTRADGVNGGVY